MFNMAATKCFGSALLMVFVVLIFYLCNFNLIDVPSKVFVHSLWTNESATSLYDAKMNHKVVIQFGSLVVFIKSLYQNAVIVNLE